MLNILIACDHKSSRESLIALLSAQPDFNIISVCADTHAAIAITGREKPDIVLIDGSTDPLAVIEAIKKITTGSTAGVIALSRHADRGFAQHMMAAGALGYLTSQSSAVEVITAVEEVSKDNCYSCLETRHKPIATPEHLSSFKKSLGSMRNKACKKISQAVENHWHGILKFTN